ncbi:sensor histidine kinase [Streptomyces sp. NPDC017448]|uniref:sensor histidine kinase n=1 Tax=Streptomyces sp. NPDC017448 TaxID=3364996 RepID=UPI0037BB85D9
MIGRVRGWRRGWHERSKLQRIDLYTRVTLCSIIWLFAVSWGLLPLGETLDRGAVAIALGGAFLAANVVQSVLSSRNLAPAFEDYRGTAPFPARRLRLPAALQTVMTGLLVALAGVGGVKDEGLVLLVLDLPVAFAVPYVLLVPVRRFLLHAAAFSVAGVALLAAVGVPGGQLFGAFVSLAVVTLLVLVSARPSAWSLSVMWQAEEARDMQARLAVAEERLRFGRDMHDVLGRNLSVIALKSELAVELAQRGNPAAMDQMVEVQRIARASQQEVRDVVRGYREADLPTELMGARGVLEAAGISVGVEGADGPAGIGAPAAVQAALGWVVRETATNVLRHGDPRHCRIRLTRTWDAVVLEVENDGAGPAGPGDGGPGDGGGAGLRGLRERLGALGGTLSAGRAGDDLFRVTATVPLTGPRTRPGGRAASSPASATSRASSPPATPPTASDPAASRTSAASPTASDPAASPTSSTSSASSDPASASAPPEER